MLITLNYINTSKAQVNLVPNGGFEQYTSCPNSTAQLSNTGNWFFAGGSTDYFNACEPTNFVSVPSNVVAYQNAYDGSAYVGVITFALDELIWQLSPFNREPACTQLIQPLIIGEKYFVSFKVNLALNNYQNCCASNKTGALFSTTAFTDLGSGYPAPINNFAHIYTDSIITDTVNWTMISGSFIADSAYNYITIGNFFDTINTSYIDFYNNFPVTAAAYYFIDDVKVSTDSNFVVSDKIDLKADKKLEVFPNPTENQIHLKSKYEIKQIEFLDILGNSIAIYHYENKKEIILGSEFLENGIYLIRVKTLNNIFNSTICIKR